ncbi:MAG: ATP-binding cassette domain-containing protein [Prevotella sp.]|nr:ATP-binding cassette domain-containing protein [Prevotella sp.]
MLEFKNVSVALGQGRRSLPVSVVMESGEMVCICGPQGSGKTRLLRAVMGLEPVADGYLTFDGELVGVGSASYFRRLIAYVPQHLPDQPMLVSELCRSVLDLRANASIHYDKPALMDQWQLLGLDASLYDCQANELAPETLQTVLISLLPFLKRPVILLDDMPQTHTVYEFVRRLTSDGVEVLYTCEHQAVPCDKLIKL